VEEKPEFVDPNLVDTDGLDPETAEALQSDDVYDPADNGNQPS
jgi:hypothetical protein